MDEEFFIIHQIFSGDEIEHVKPPVRARYQFSASGLLPLLRGLEKIIVKVARSR